MLKISVHNVDIVNESKIIEPPIVGVPFFAEICHSGPSNLIGWPFFVSSLVKLIM